MTRQTSRPESIRSLVPMAETGGGPRPDPTTYAATARADDERPSTRSEEPPSTRSDDERRATANRTTDRTPT